MLRYLFWQGVTKPETKAENWLRIATFVLNLPFVALGCIFAYIIPGPKGLKIALAIYLSINALYTGVAMNLTHIQEKKPSVKRYLTIWWGGMFFAFFYSLWGSKKYQEKINEKESQKGE